MDISVRSTVAYEVYRDGLAKSRLGWAGLGLAHPGPVESILHQTQIAITLRSWKLGLRQRHKAYDSRISHPLKRDTILTSKFLSV